MTEIKCINSDSSGNGFVISSNGKSLVVELGCRFRDYLDSGVDFGSIVGCVATHAHGDHINRSTANEFMRRGVQCFANINVVINHELRQFVPLLNEYRNKVGGFIVQTFEVPHNVLNYGFLITTPTNERILFVTDTSGIRSKFKDIDAIMVECNHDGETLLDNLDKHDVGMGHPEFHMGLNECKRFCKANISASTKQIILIHLSHANVNEQHAVETIKEYCNFDNVAVAHMGDKFIIDNDDF